MTGVNSLESKVIINTRASISIIPCTIRKTNFQLMRTNVRPATSVLHDSQTTVFLVVSLKWQHNATRNHFVQDTTTIRWVTMDLRASKAPILVREQIVILLNFVEKSYVRKEVTLVA